MGDADRKRRHEEPNGAAVPRRTAVVLNALLATPKDQLERFRQQYGATATLSLERLGRARDLLETICGLLLKSDERHWHWVEAAWTALRRLDESASDNPAKVAAILDEETTETVALPPEQLARLRSNLALPFDQPTAEATPAEDGDTQRLRADQRAPALPPRWNDQPSDESAEKTAVLPDALTTKLRQQLGGTQRSVTVDPAEPNQPPPESNDPEAQQATAVLPDIDYAKLRRELGIPIGQRKAKK